MPSARVAAQFYADHTHFGVDTPILIGHTHFNIIIAFREKMTRRIRETVNCGGRECQRATSGKFGVSEISETPPGSRSSGFSELRVLGAPGSRRAPGSRSSGFSARPLPSSSSSKKRPNIDKRQEYVATLQSFPRYCQHWKRFVVERCV